MAINLSSVVALGPSKEAAFYFERVMPADLGAAVIRSLKPEAGEYIPRNGMNFDESVTESLLGNRSLHSEYVRMTNLGLIVRVVSMMRQDPNFSDLGDLTTNAAMEKLFASEGMDLHIILKEIRNNEFDYNSITGPIALKLTEISKKIGFSDAPIWDFSRDKEVEKKDIVEEERFILSLRNVSLVDTSAIDWPTVVEFRRDKASMQALRDLRLLFHQDYREKEQSFIEDDLGNKLDKYQEVARSWKFDLADKSFSAFFSKEGAASSVMGLGAAAMSGSPILGAGALALGAVGKVVFEISRDVRSRRRAELDSPVRYISKLKKL